MATFNSKESLDAFNEKYRELELKRRALAHQMAGSTYKDPRVMSSGPLNQPPWLGPNIALSSQEKRRRTFFDELRSGKWREVDKEKAADLVSLGMDVYILGCDSDSPFRISNGGHQDLPKWYITKFVINKHSDAYSFLVKVEE